jgi:hypothetical protein
MTWCEGLHYCVDRQIPGQLILAAEPSGMTGLVQKGMPGTADYCAVDRYLCLIGRWGTTLF